MGKQKPLNYPIAELDELRKDIKKDIRELEYWEKLYSRKLHRSETDVESTWALKQALKGLRFTLSLKRKKHEAVVQAIEILETLNVHPD